MPKLKFLISRVTLNNTTIPIINAIPRFTPVTVSRQKIKSNNDKHNFKTWQEVVLFWLDFNV